jgi:integrase
MSMARLANERRMIPSMPTCPSVVLPDRVATAWSEAELVRLYTAAEAVSGFVGFVPANFFWPLLILTAFESGERIGALLEVRREHYARPNLHIPGELRKGGRRSRVYELSATVCDRIEAILLRDNADHIFEWPHPRTYVWDRLKKILAAAGLSGKRVGFQQVRRSAISHMAKAGADPVAFAGHAQAATTRKWYLDPRYADRGPRPSDLLPRIHKAHTDPPPPQVCKRAGRRDGT